jgi:hypothetical protein
MVVVLVPWWGREVVGIFDEIIRLPAGIEEEAAADGIDGATFMSTS